MLCGAVLFASVPAQAQSQAASLQSVLAARAAAMKAIGAHAPSSLHVTGTLEGAALSGFYQTWFSAQGQRYDESMGLRTQTTLRRADGHMYAVDENGNVREIRGLLLERQRTQDFIDEEKFTSQPQYVTYKGTKTLDGGRSVYALIVQPPDGQAEEVDLDTHSLMIDRISYDEMDGTASSDFYDYKVFAGALIAQRELDSNGDHAFDLTHTVTRILVDRPIPVAMFDVPKNNEIRTGAPVTVKLEYRGSNFVQDRISINHPAPGVGHYYTTVTIRGQDFTFLVDTGAQGIVIDSRVAEQLGLPIEGKLEVSGAQRVGGLGIAPLDQLRVGSAVLPLRTVDVLDLRNVTPGVRVDGVLGYPFFASAEVRIDAAAGTMTIARPGTLDPHGTPATIDVDRELIEMQARVNGVDGRFILDTGNSAELLLYKPFLDHHPNLLPVDFHPFSTSYGVGGSAQAVFAYVDELDLSGFRFFNRESNLMQAASGAFADRFDAGNIGMGVLGNLVVTFDVADAKAYFVQSAVFDDGRYRDRTERIKPTIP